MLNMIIADDEPIARNGIRNAIPWRDYGITIVAEAVNGQEALDLCRDLKPDILFTDIRMPFFDGLEVAQQLKDDGLAIRIIFFSGIEDFQYARTALSVQADGYILKPIRLQEMKEVIERTINRIKLEHNREEKLENARMQLHQHMPLVREKLFINIISRMIHRQKDLEEKLKYLSIDIVANEPLIAAVLRLDEYALAVERYSEEHKHLLHYSISNIVEEIMHSYKAGTSFSRDENEFVLVFVPRTLGRYHPQDVCEEVRSSVERFLNLSVSCGIGGAVSAISHLHQSYQDAAAALEFKFYTGAGSIIHIDDLKSSQGSTVFPDSRTIGEPLLTAMKLGHSEAVERLLAEWFQSVKKTISMQADYVQAVCAELVLLASQALIRIDERMEESLLSKTKIIDHIYNQPDIDRLERYLTELFVHMTTHLNQRNNQKNAKTIEKVHAIIEQRYAENISVSSIAEEIFLSPNYISALFKQETGVTITDKLTSVRMEEAQRLLRSTSLKILEIAEMTGYVNPQYFSTVFKKYSGMHPQKFRTLHQ